MSKRKAYNRVKQLNRVADHILKNIVVCYVDRLQGCVLLDTKRNHIVKPNDALIASVGRPHQWSCTIIALGRDGDTEYFKSEFIKAQSKYYQQDLSTVFEENHQRLLKEMNPNHLAGAAWIASTQGFEFSDDQVCKMLNNLGAWE